MAEKMNSRPVTAVFAYSEVGYVCLEELLKKGANVAIVFTHEDAADENIWFRSVKDLALSHKIPVRAGSELSQGAAELLSDMRAELIFSFYYRAVIPAKVLEIPSLGAYNMHGALLPKYRGRACVNWAVLNGETETGSTLHVMTARPDRGDIVDREKVAILYEDTAHDVFLKVAEASRKIISRSLDALEAGTARREPQDESLATEFGRRTPADGLIDWNKTAAELYNMVRALTRPFPGAFTLADGGKMYVWKSRVLSGTAKPGEVVSSSPPVYGTGEGLLEIMSYQLERESGGSF